MTACRRCTKPLRLDDYLYCEVCEDFVAQLALDAALDRALDEADDDD
jgi:hypothetical protein